MKKTILLAVFLLLFTTAAHAQGLPAASNAPVEISAKKSLEWNRRNRTYTAREDVLARQGNFEMKCDVLTATYDSKRGGTSISQMVATGSVVLSSPPYTAFGDKAVYDVAGGTATLTGEGLKIRTETETLAARDSIVFFSAENRLTATGRAVATRGTDTLRADILNAFFQKDSAGKMFLHRMTATGGVTVKTARETVYGDEGVYDVVAKKAVLTGKVRIQQGESFLEGTRAEVDLTSGISQLFASENMGTDGRVRGVFYPEDKKEQP